jgi:hypothetical protein
MRDNILARQPYRPKWEDNLIVVLVAELCEVANKRYQDGHKWYWQEDVAWMPRPLMPFDLCIEYAKAECGPRFVRTYGKQAAKHALEIFVRMTPEEIADDWTKARWHQSWVETVHKYIPGTSIFARVRRWLWERYITI